MKKGTKFQQTLPGDKETLWKIVKLFHPDIPDEFVNRKSIRRSIKDEFMTAYPGNYDWVSIRFKVPGYGDISLGINNAHQVRNKFWGPDWTLQEFKIGFQEGEFDFRIWRFVDDTLYINSLDLSKDELHDQYVEILKSAGYELQSPQEFYHNYFKD